MKEKYLTFIESIKNAKSVILTSVDSDGYPSSRAMLTIQREWSLKEMYFSTNTSSSKVNEFLKNNKASIYFYDENNFQGVCLKGMITVMQDQRTKDFFWHEGDESYYPSGKTDPDYTILKFEPFRGSYYGGSTVEKFKLY